ncbi:MAG: hypothetical protein RLZZ336_1045 [Cyanobacteriota bacterium]
MTPCSAGPMTLQRQLDALHQACCDCRRCSLAAERQQVVVSRGNPSARLLLIGEAPGADEDARGLPFVGRSGQLLDRLLVEAGLDPRDDLYLCNAIKCRPPANRRPRPSELAACRPWLAQQIRLVDPALVLLVGGTALEAVLAIKGGITALRGRWLGADQGPMAAALRGRRLMPLLHPSYLLRFAAETEGSPRALTRADLQEVRRQLSALV